MIITQTPFRVSFFGGGTDYPEYFRKHGGAVLGTAIDYSGVVTVMHFQSHLFDYSMRLAYRKVECVSEIGKIEHPVFRACLSRFEIDRDIEINYAAELPSFSGLGTSSSFVVGLLNALSTHRGRYMSPLELAQAAIEIERDVLGDAVGCQDQTFAAFGGFNLVEFTQSDDIVVHRVPLTAQRIADIESHLLLVFTGITRRASELAARQIKKVDDNAKTLARMRTLVDEGLNALVNQDSLEKFGRLLHESWMLKQSLDDAIATGPIGEAYKTGLEAGAFGGKLLGAGGGGFILFIVPPEKRQHLRDKLRHLHEIPLRINAPGCRVLHSS